MKIFKKKNLYISDAFPSKSEMVKYRFHSHENKYLATFFAEKVCTYFNMELPPIKLKRTLHPIGIKASGTTAQMGRTVTPLNIKWLKVPHVYLATKNVTQAEFIGTLFHELRHVWQYYFNREINEFPAIGFQESLLHPAEIDADAFAIAALSLIMKISLLEAADIVCPDEKNIPIAFNLRLNQSKKFVLNTQMNKEGFKIKQFKGEKS